MHEEEQWDIDRYAEAAVGELEVREANASGLNELGWRGLVRVVIHDELIFNVPSRQSLEADLKVQARRMAALELVSQLSAIHRN